MEGDPRRAAWSPMVTRPLVLGHCRLTECQRDLSFGDLFWLNLTLDEDGNADTP